MVKRSGGGWGIAGAAAGLWLVLPASAWAQEQGVASKAGDEVEADALALEPEGAANLPDTAASEPRTSRSTPPPEQRLELSWRELPKHRPYRGEEELDGYVLQERWRKGLVIPGVALIGAAYFSGLAVASFDDFDNQKGFLALPVAGPWLTLLTRDDDCTSDVCGPRRLLTASGVIQAVGLGMTIVGATWQKRLWVREDLAVQLAPQQFAFGGFGAGVSGVF